MEKSPSDFIELGEDEEDALLKSDNEETAEDENAEHSSADDDDDDDDDDEEEDEDMEKNNLKEYLNLEKDIQENPLDYDNYIKLIDIAYKLDDLEKLRNAYTIFAAKYPITPTLWLKLLKIEKSLATSATEINRVEVLFRKALEDYYCSKIALEFAEFAFKCTDPERIWSELLSTYALDVMVGRQFFEMYRKYNEQRNCSTDEKRKYYIQSYVKELKTPLQEMEKSYIDFKVYYEKNKNEIPPDLLDWNKVDKYYKRAKKDYSLMLPFEETLQSLDIQQYREKANTYKEYIQSIYDFVDDNVLQTVYERMITDCCLNENCWIEYIEFVEKCNEFTSQDDADDNIEIYPVFKQTALSLNARALRNCIWSEKLVIQRLHIMERLEKPITEAQQVIENAFQMNDPRPEPAVSIWLAYLSYLRRQTNYEVEQEVEVLRKNFDFCWNFLGKTWGVLADCNCEILQFWGRLEYGPLKDPTKGKELWTTVMESSDNSLKSGLWIEFAQLEIRNNMEATRKIYQKALKTSSIDNPYVIASAWLRFERCHGTLRHTIMCEKTCETLLKEYESKYMYKEFHNSETITSKTKGSKRKSETKIQENPKKQHADDKFKNPFEKFESKNLPPPAKKAKYQEKQQTEKQHENEEIDLSKDHLRIFLSNLDYNITEDDVRNGLTEISIINVNLIKTATGKGRGFGYLELSSEDDVKRALELDRKLINGRPVFVSSVLRDKEKREKFKYSGELEPKKIFVKGIPHDTTTEELHNLFEPFGKLTNVRIVYHKSGKPKGIAYVEYANESNASLAVMKMDNYMLRDCQFNVAISAPPPKSTNLDNILHNIAPKKVIGQKGEQRTRMNFIPTSVRKNITSTAAKPDSTSSQNGTPKPMEPLIKSNEEFRKLLLQKNL